MAKYLLVFSGFASVVLIISNALAFEMNPSRMSMSMKERSDLFAEKVGLIAKETHYLFSKKDIEHLFSSSSRYNHMVYCDNNENCAFEIWDLHSITGKQATAVVFIAESGNGARSSLLEDIVFKLYVPLYFPFCSSSSTTLRRAIPPRRRTGFWRPPARRRDNDMGTANSTKIPLCSRFPMGLSVEIW